MQQTTGGLPLVGDTQRAELCLVLVLLILAHGGQVTDFVMRHLRRAQKYISESAFWREIGTVVTKSWLLFSLTPPTFTVLLIYAGLTHCTGQTHFDKVEVQS